MKNSKQKREISKSTQFHKLTDTIPNHLAKAEHLFDYQYNIYSLHNEDPNLIDSDIAVHLIQNKLNVVSDLSDQLMLERLKTYLLSVQKRIGFRLIFKKNELSAYLSNETRNYPKPLTNEQVVTQLIKSSKQKHAIL